MRFLFLHLFVVLSYTSCRFVIIYQQASIKSIDSLVGNTAGGITDKLRNVIKQLKVSDTQGLPYELFLKLGARYLMTLNNDTLDGLVNGATGLLRKIVYGTQSDTLERVPCILWIEFDDPTVGKDKRAKSQHRYLRDSTIQRNWTPIGLETRRFQRIIFSKTTYAICSIFLYSIELSHFFITNACFMCINESFPYIFGNTFSTTWERVQNIHGINKDLITQANKKIFLSLGSDCWSGFRVYRGCLIRKYY